MAAVGTIIQDIQSELMIASLYRVYSMTWMLKVQALTVLVTAKQAELSSTKKCSSVRIASRANVSDHIT